MRFWYFSSEIIEFMIPGSGPKIGLYEPCTDNASKFSSLTLIDENYTIYVSFFFSLYNPSV